MKSGAVMLISPAGMRSLSQSPSEAHESESPHGSDEDPFRFVTSGVGQLLELRPDDAALHPVLGRLPTYRLVSITHTPPGVTTM